MPPWQTQVRGHESVVLAERVRHDVPTRGYVLEPHLRLVRNGPHRRELIADVRPRRRRFEGRYKHERHATVPDRGVEIERRRRERGFPPVGTSRAVVFAARVPNGTGRNHEKVIVIGVVVGHEHHGHLLDLSQRVDVHVSQVVHLLLE